MRNSYYFWPKLLDSIVIIAIVCRKNVNNNRIDFVFSTIYNRHEHSLNKIECLGKFIFKKSSENLLSNDRFGFQIKIGVDVSSNP